MLCNSPFQLPALLLVLSGLGVCGTVGLGEGGDGRSGGAEQGHQLEGIISPFAEVLGGACTAEDGVIRTNHVEVVLMRGKIFLSIRRGTQPVPG